MSTSSLTELICEDSPVFWSLGWARLPICSTVTSTPYTLEGRLLAADLNPL